MNLDKNIENTFHLINHVRSSPSEFISKYQNATNIYNDKILRDKVKTR